jgi:hypothetical protein
MSIDTRIPRVSPPPAGPRRPVGRGRNRSRLVVLAALLVVAIGAGAAWRQLERAAPGCNATIGSETYTVDLDQAANARTIADQAARSGMPHHAVTVALAAAFQESKLRNLAYGDRDSIGLFQQRPSQGWGSPGQLADPAYAAGAFYRALARVDGWSTMSVTDAAQHVQRSSAPDAYAQWEPEARVLARILTGEVPDRLVCTT